MDKLAIITKTLTGELVIAGRLQANNDLSFGRLEPSLHLQSFELGRNFDRYQKLSQKTLSAEFNVIPIQSIRQLSYHPCYIDMLAGVLPSEIVLNRYNNCLPCNFYTVKWNNVEIPDSYINASFISGPDFPSQKNSYIATQGPLPHTISHFWKMVLLHKCSNIVMLCRQDECEKVRHI
jgi:protein tyrosine phosphatase